MKRFFIKSVACISIAFFLAVVLPIGLHYNTANAQISQSTVDNAQIIKNGCKVLDIACNKTYAQAAKDKTAIDYLINEASDKLLAGDADGAKLIEDKLNPVIASDPLFLLKLQSAKDQIYTSYSKKLNDQLAATQNDFLATFNKTNAEAQQQLRDEAAQLKDTDPEKAADLIQRADKLQALAEKTNAEAQGMLSKIASSNNCRILDINCNFEWFLSKKIWPDIKGKTLEVLNMILTTIAGWLALILSWCASGLDTAISLTMQLGKQKVLLDSLKQVWSILRDTLNLSFIFILLYISIQTIIQGSKFQTKKMLANIVVAAILINFSLMITNIIIDTSNIFTNAIYNQATNGTNITLSTKIISGLKLETAFKTSLPSASTGLTTFTLTRIVMYSVLIWAFIQGFVLILTRTIVFLFLMALSPLGFMGNILTKIKEYSDKWWSTLIDQALVGPVFIFFLLLITKLIDGGLGNILDTIGKATSGQQIGGLISIVANIAIIVGFIITAVKVTKKLSGEAGAFLSNAASGLAGALTVGAGGMLLRNTVGRGAAALLKNDKVQAIAARVPGGGIALKGINNVAKSSFDVRNSTLGKTLEKQGLSLGKAGGKDGFQGQVDRAQKSMIATGKSLEADMGSSRSRALVKEKVVENQNKIISDSVEAKGTVEKEIQELKNKYQAKSQELKENLPPEAKKAAKREQQQISDKILQKEKEMVENEKKRQAAEKKLQAIANGEAVSEKDLSDDEVKAIQSRHQNAYADSQEAKNRPVFKGRGSIVGVAMGGFIGHRANVKALRKSFKGKSANDLLVEQMKKEKEAEDAKKAPTEEAKPKS